MLEPVRDDFLAGQRSRRKHPVHPSLRCNDKARNIDMTLAAPPFAADTRPTQLISPKGPLTCSTSLVKKVSKHKPFWPAVRCGEGTHWLAKAVVVFQIMCLLLHQSLSVVSAEETCRLNLVVQVIRYNQCIPRRILAPSCSGTCDSYVAVDENTLMFRRTCRCCQPLEVVTNRLFIRCPDTTGRRRYVRAAVRFNRIRSCQCRPCSQLSEIHAGEVST